MNDNINNNNNDQNNMSIDSLTVDYNNLYKLESTDKEEKIEITDQDLQFDNADHIEDQNLIDKIDREDTKHNIIFMVIVVLILIVVIVFLFPIFIKLKIK